MKNPASYAVISEMLETPGILRRFDPLGSAAWACEVASKGKLLVTGEGSSRIFPAKNMLALAARSGHPWRLLTEGARQALECNLAGYSVLAASNSGRTRELVALFEHLQHENVPRYVVTATAGSRITQIADGTRVLSCGVEKAVPATKTVFEQALVFQSMLGGSEWAAQGTAADACEAVLTREIPPDIVQAVKNAPVIYFAGRNDGVAEELALKANEILRRRAAYLEGTLVLHGVEEVMQPGDAVVLVAPFQDDMEKYEEVLKAAGVNVVAISTVDTPFLTVKIPAMTGFDNYLCLLAGWNILASAGIAAGIDIDKPLRARKVGNEIK